MVVTARELRILKRFFGEHAVSVDERGRVFISPDHHLGAYPGNPAYKMYLYQVIVNGRDELTLSEANQRFADRNYQGARQPDAPNLIRPLPNGGRLVNIPNRGWTELAPDGRFVESTNVDQLIGIYVGSWYIAAFAGGGGLLAGEVGAGWLLVRVVAPQSSGVTVLGHYPAYMNLASRLGAKRFSIPTHVWERMTDAQRWAANKKFLDRAIKRGDEIILATPVNQVRPGSWFARELQYLYRMGYKVSADGCRLIRPQ